MGVTGLWDVVKPVARPVKLETLNRKRLAVDASIWIYQFLKAVRDKEGNALRNSHVVGFLRRICKLLYFGIKPVFVFDGGAPILKRQTIIQRKARREGRREDVVRTAGKILAKQMQHRAEEDQRKRREARERPAQLEEELPEELTYVEEQMMTPEQKKQNRQFKRKDAYHLPDLDVSLNEMGAPNDPRIMSQEELEDYARQFNEGEDINLYDFSKIDFDGPFFTSLPATDRYNILNAARLRSRLRMGYSKEQLDVMFPNRMDFSRFQIERVAERNELTQRLMNLNGMNGNDFGSGRVAGEKGIEYMLVRNEGVEGGWALGVVSNKDEGQREKPIDLDKPEVPLLVQAESEDDDFEDIPIEGLNRLPKRPKPLAPSDKDATDHGNDGMQSAFFDDYQAPIAEDDDEGLFVPVVNDPAEDENEEEEDMFEDVPAPTVDNDIEDEELQRAIAMSLQNDSDDDSQQQQYQRAADAARSDRKRKEQVLSFDKRQRTSGRNFANYANARAAKAAPRASDSDITVNPELRAAFEAGRKMGPRKKQEQQPQAKGKAPEVGDALAQPSQFKGPLPFESINLGRSLFSKKKAKGSESEAEAEEGGFEKKKEDRPKTPPPWFTGDIGKEHFQHSLIAQDEDTESTKVKRSAPVLRQERTKEVVDLEADDKQGAMPIDLVSSDEEDVMPEELVEADPKIRLDDVADTIRVEPPIADPKHPQAPYDDPNSRTVKQAIERVSDHNTVVGNGIPEIPASHVEKLGTAANGKEVDSVSPKNDVDSSLAPEALDWEESDLEDPEQYKVLANHEPNITTDTKPAQRVQTDASPEPDFEDVDLARQPAQSPSPEPDFENVPMPDQENASREPQSPRADELAEMAGTLEQDLENAALADDVNFEDEFSDPEDEDLMKQLADEAEEHARFAAQLNTGTELQTAADYERELKQLRNQQKAERRDADEVSQVMVTECQQLLRLFGLPYITAPMEAEAQCAELHRLGLVDGIVTDDSDIFLFGGTRVYKNMFNQAKEVQVYLASDMEKEYGLGREKVIQIAQLLGSDYTEGIPNVGPVTALEILTEFGDLHDFASWWTDVQTGIAPQESKGFKKRFRKNATKIFLPPGFPDVRVDQAYLKPEVDNDRSEFQWGVPDLDALRQFLMATIGWSQMRTDEILVPVIKDINRRDAEGTQANITKFFGGATGAGPAGAGRDAYAPRRKQGGTSARMENALGRLHEQTKQTVQEREVEEQHDEQNAEKASASEPANRKRKAGTRKANKNNNHTGAADSDEGDKPTESDEDDYQPKKARKGAKGKRKPAKN